MDNTTLELQLQKYFGYAHFRPIQKEVIAHILDGKDALLLLPTGGGKSICFQLPALILEGLTIVISPLISLMKDQVESLKGNGIAAEFLNSNLAYGEDRVIMQRIAKGELKLLYISPERFVSQGFIDYLKSLPIALFAIDEAHCISSWGHDFRPEYAMLNMIKINWPTTPVLALTATADKDIRTDIISLLALVDAKTFLGSFDRPNLSLEVRPAQLRLAQIENIINAHKDECGIIYCSSRKNTEELTEKLINRGYDAAYYHAGLDIIKRNNVQEDFIKGKTQIIVATIAFGMGIDKPDVRFVIHYNLPKNIESLYQEIGRGGRDGLPCETVLFYGYGDVQTQIFFIDQIVDEHFRNIQTAKLEQIQQYAESQVCRRRFLLNYFSEYTSDDCGNCDVCMHPPKSIDGTIFAQMALSGIKRTEEKAAMGLLIDVLRGSQTIELKEKGYTNLKTYGVGRNITHINWQMYLQQMKHQGLIEIDYRDHNHLKVTELGNEVLFQGRKVKLVNFDVIKSDRDNWAARAKPKSQKQNLEEELIQLLKQKRKEIADELGKPAFTVFSDATLLDMVQKMPVNHKSFKEVTGIGEFKANQYGLIFIQIIQDFVAGKSNEDLIKLGATQKYSCELFTLGKSIEEIAEMRSYSISTIYSHLTKYVKDLNQTDIARLITHEELKAIDEARKIVSTKEAIVGLFNHLKGTISYEKLRLGLAYLRNEDTNKGN